MVYTVWGIDGVPFAFKDGEDPAVDEDGPLELLWRFEAGSDEEAERRYEEWAGGGGQDV
jgi:hypothetical protein